MTNIHIEEVLVEIERIAKRNTHRPASNPDHNPWNKAVETMRSELIDAIQSLKTA